VQSIEVSCRLPQGQQAREVTVYSPDSNVSRLLAATTSGATAAFTVPEVKTYSIAVVSYS
jgi:hypothetical protein